MVVYWDCNATTPLDPRVREEMLLFLTEEYGNSGSRHEFGDRANKAVEKARGEVASVVGSTDPKEVVFTSGATEANNLAILGLADHGLAVGRKHIISTSIEHKAVLEPLEVMEQRGFTVELLSVGLDGRVDPEHVRAALRPDTLLVSVMHANNETGILQPLAEISSALASHEAFLHVDAAQTFTKEAEVLLDPRIDLLSVSAHKIHGPKGIGALIGRRRGFSRPPLKPLMYGGGQERGLRPGTAPVALQVAFGAASRLGFSEHGSRRERCLEYRRKVLDCLEPLRPQINGAEEYCLPHVLNLSFPGMSSEAVMLALKGVAAVSNGSACTAKSYKASHVLTAMGLTPDRVKGGVRISWSHETAEPDWSEVRSAIQRML